MARTVGPGGLVGMAFAVCWVGACSSTVAPSQLTGMHFAAMTEFPSNPPPAVDVTVGMVPAQNIYAMTVALPDFPPGAYNCPIDLGISYKLTFFSGDAIAATASLLPGGCRDVQISDSPPLRWAFDNGYWAALAQQLGVPQSTIY